MLKYSALLLLLLLVPVPGSTTTGQRSLTILFTGDLHSQLTPRRQADGRTAGGFARLAAAIRAEKTAHPGAVITVDAGDFSMGTLYHTLFREEAAELRLLGNMGYDAVVPGNHEFDFGCGGLASMLDSARLKANQLPAVLLANSVMAEKNEETATLRREFRRNALRDYIVVERSGLRIGIFGLMGKEAGRDVNAAGITFSDPADRAREISGILKEKERADFIVCLAHCGTSLAGHYPEEEAIASGAPLVDVIVSGHGHLAFARSAESGNALLAAGGVFGASLGVLELSRGKNGMRINSFFFLPMDDSRREEKSVSRTIAMLHGLVQSRYLNKKGYGMEQALAYCPFPMLPLEKTYECAGQNPMGDLVTDAFRRAVKRAEAGKDEPVNLAVAVLGHVRDTFLPGPVTPGDAFRVLSIGCGEDGAPGYPLAAFYLYGSDIIKLFEVQGSIVPYLPDASLQISGVRFRVNPNRVIFDRVFSAEIDRGDGKYVPLEPSRLYRVCMNLFVARNLGKAPEFSFGLISIVPRDRQGRVLNNLSEAIVDSDPHRPGTQELKEWTALADFLKALPIGASGLPEIPVSYQRPDARCVVIPSWSPVAVFGGAGKTTMAAIMGGSIFLFPAGLFLFRRIKRTGEKC